MPKLTLAEDADSYHGTDPGNDHKPIDLQPGDSVDVSAEKAEQLLADFPDRFKKGRAAPKKTEPPKASDYKDVEGDELRTLAKSRGLDVGDADDATIRAALITQDEAAAAS